MKKIFFSFTIFLACVFMFTACSNKTDDVKEADAKKTIYIFLPGKKDDNGFMAAGFRGYEKIVEKFKDSNIQYVDNISATSDISELTEALSQIADKKPDLIIAHGGQNNGPVEVLAKEYPDVNFVVTQGNVKAKNVASYVVDQEQSAYLAGALAGLMTKTNKVGHISGAWPKPGLMARAAFYDGLMKTNPKAEFFSTFTGNLDDGELNREAAISQLDSGVDIIYTMLNSGRSAVTEAIKERPDTFEIGNVIDWTKEDDVFIASAVADSSDAVFKAASDFLKGDLKFDEIKKMDLTDSNVDIAMGEKVPKALKDEILKLKDELISGKLKINTEYQGKEFDPITKEFVSQDKKEEDKK